MDDCRWTSYPIWIQAIATTSNKLKFLRISTAQLQNLKLRLQSASKSERHSWGRTLPATLTHTCVPAQGTQIAIATTMQAQYHQPQALLSKETSNQSKQSTATFFNGKGLQTVFQ